MDGSPKYADESVDMDWLCEICFCGLPLWESQRFLQPKFENLEIDRGYVKGERSKMTDDSTMLFWEGGNIDMAGLNVSKSPFEMVHSVILFSFLRLDVCFFTIWFSLWISSMYIHAFPLSGMTINEFGFPLMEPLSRHEAGKWLRHLRSPLRSRSPSLLFVSQGLCFC